MTSEQILHAPVMWAQRKNMVTLTINVEDCKDPEIKVEPTQVQFRGTGGAEKKTYEAKLELFDEIDPENSNYFVRERSIEFFLKKKVEGPFWPQLLKDKKKVHWLKIDFNRWRDEEDSEGEAEGAGEGGNSQDLEEMMRQMGGLGGMGGMGGPGMGMDKPDLNDLEDEDSDDGEMPDLE